jgi:hypothetical protein
MHPACVRACMLFFFVVRGACRQTSTEARPLCAGIYRPMVPGTHMYARQRVCVCVCVCVPMHLTHAQLYFVYAPRPTMIVNPLSLSRVKLISYLVDSTRGWLAVLICSYTNDPCQVERPTS